MENNIELVDQQIERQEVAIRVSRAFKKYGFKNNSNIVLDNLNMKVEKGAIYGLLGASGCGKTTLLTCIVGCKNIDSGIIRVLGGEPGKRGSGAPGIRLGYMPQEMALLNDFTIEETFKYFGWLGGMKTNAIHQRKEELMKLLDLPAEKIQAEKLSGGEQRRLSLAVAMFHDPELLVLDEPTVGLDPVLRESIWQYFLKITEDCKKTVILSTHYIEEARGASKIGLMRGGRLLIEGSPEELLERYECDRLEDIFLQLSNLTEIGQEADTGSPQVVLPLEFKEEIHLPDSERRFANDKMPTFNIYKALIWRNVLWYLKNKRLMLATISACLITTTLPVFTIGKTPINLRLAVVNKEKMGHLHCDTTLSLDNGTCHKSPISCIFLKQLSDNKSYVLKSFETMEDARLSVKKGRAWGVLHFNENFSKSLIERFKGEIGVSTKVLQDSEMLVNLDMSNQVISTIIYRDLQFVFSEVITKLQKQCKLSLPAYMNFKTPVYGNNESELIDFYYPAVLVVSLFVNGFATSCLFLQAARREKIAGRYIAFGVTTQQLIFSFLLVIFFWDVIRIICSVFLGLIILDMMHLGSITLVIALLVLSGFCSILFGLFLSILIDSMYLHGMVTMWSIGLFIFSCGGVWPLEAAHWIVQYGSLLLPVTCVIKSMRSIVLKGWDISKPDVYDGFISIFCFIMFFSILIIILLRFKKLVE